MIRLGSRNEQFTLLRIHRIVQCARYHGRLDLCDTRSERLDTEHQIIIHRQHILLCRVYRCVWHRSLSFQPQSWAHDTIYSYGYNARHSSGIAHFRSDKHRDDKQSPRFVGEYVVVNRMFRRFLCGMFQTVGWVI